MSCPSKNVLAAHFVTRTAMVLIPGTSAEVTSNSMARREPADVPMSTPLTQSLNHVSTPSKRRVVCSSAYPRVLLTLPLGHEERSKL